MVICLDTEAEAKEITVKYELWSKMGILNAEHKKAVLKKVENALIKEVEEGKLLPFTKQYPNASIRLDEGRLMGDAKYKGSLLDEESGFIVIFSMDEALNLTIATTMSIQPQPGSPGL